MKKIISHIAVICFLCFLSIAPYAQTPNWLWAKAAGGTFNDEATSVAVDALGNTYVAGEFLSTAITFGSTTFTNNVDTTQRMFLAKYDANGNVLWAIRSDEPPHNANVYSVTCAVDANGNCFVSGYFEGDTLFLGPYTIIYPNTIFLAKYDTNGNILWAKSAGKSGTTELNSVAVDVSGNAYVTGWFNTDTIKFGSINLINKSLGSPMQINIFVVKYDTDGNILWAKSGGGTGWGFANSIALDASGNAYVTGYFTSPTFTCGSVTLANTYDSTYNIFLAKYDTYGNVLWAKNAGEQVILARRYRIPLLSMLPGIAL
jgi:hypothetical protein